MNEITEKKTVFTVYSHDEDMTFIMEDTYDANGEPLSTECVGWYHGAPNDEDTAAYTGKLKAEYLMGREKDEMMETMARADREANFLYLKGMMKSHEEWKAKHPRTKKER